MTSTDDRTAGYAVQHTDAEWRAILKSDARYEVLRNGRTERPFSSVLEKAAEGFDDGAYVCAACPEAALFDPRDKFDSGTGWPSFSRPISGAVEIEDVVLPSGLSRLQKPLVTMKEVRCAKCGGHLGHVFDDGFLFPLTAAFGTNNRFCINGSAIAFRSNDKKEEEDGGLVYGDSCRSPRTLKRFNECLLVPLTYRD